MAFGVPECDYTPAVRLFRVRKAIGKTFSSGGFGLSLPVESQEHSETDDIETSNERSTEPTKPLPAEHLFIEEALFLFERGLLDVYDGETKLDSRRLYGMLEPLNVPLPIYLTYAHLRAQDYRVLRHVSLPDADTDADTDMHVQDDDKRQRLRKEARRTSLLTTLDDDPAAIAFDVYKPNTQFRKTNPGIPDYLVSVASYTLPSPTFVELQNLMNSCQGVPLRIATVSDSGVVIMFGVTDYGVPDISNSERNMNDTCDAAGM